MCLLWGMRGVVGDVQEPRLFAVAPPDERGGFVREPVGQIAFELLGLAVAFERDQILDGPTLHLGGEILMTAAEETVGLIKPPFQRMKFRRGAKMPFADVAGAVARRLQRLGDGDLVGR